MPIRIRRIFTALALMLLAYSCCFAQKSTTNASANRSWPTFWRQFTSAINKKDVASIRKMMPDDFSDGGGGLKPSEWLQYINENDKNGSWRDLQRSMARGTMPDRNSKGVLTRITKDNLYYFEFRKDKKWYFAGVAGD